MSFPNSPPPVLPARAGLQTQPISGKYRTEAGTGRMVRGYSETRLVQIGCDKRHATATWPNPNKTLAPLASACRQAVQGASHMLSSRGWRSHLPAVVSEYTRYLPDIQYSIMFRSCSQYIPPPLPIFNDQRTVRAAQGWHIQPCT